MGPLGGKGRAVSEKILPVSKGAGRMKKDLKKSDSLLWVPKVTL